MAQWEGDVKVLEKVREKEELQDTKSSELYDQYQNTSTEAAKWNSATLITLHASLLFVLRRLLSETVHVGYDLTGLFKNTAFVLLTYNLDYPPDSQRV